MYNTRIRPSARAFKGSTAVRALPRGQSVARARSMRPRHPCDSNIFDPTRRSRCNTSTRPPLPQLYSTNTYGYSPPTTITLGDNLLRLVSSPARTVRHCTIPYRIEPVRFVPPHRIKPCHTARQTTAQYRTKPYRAVMPYHTTPHHSIRYNTAQNLHTHKYTHRNELPRSRRDDHHSLRGSLRADGSQGRRAPHPRGQHRPSRHLRRMLLEQRALRGSHRCGRRRASLEPRQQPRHIHASL